MHDGDGGHDLSVRIAHRRGGGGDHRRSAVGTDDLELLLPDRDAAAQGPPQRERPVGIGPPRPVTKLVDEPAQRGPFAGQRRAQELLGPVVPAHRPVAAVLGDENGHRELAQNGVEAGPLRLDLVHEASPVLLQRSPLQEVTEEVADPADRGRQPGLERAGTRSHALDDADETAQGAKREREAALEAVLAGGLHAKEARVLDQSRYPHRLPGLPHPTGQVDPGRERRTLRCRPETIDARPDTRPEHRAPELTDVGVDGPEGNHLPPQGGADRLQDPGDRGAAAPMLREDLRQLGRQPRLASEGHSR